MGSGLCSFKLVRDAGDAGKSGESRRDMSHRLWRRLRHRICGNACINSLGARRTGQVTALTETLEGTVEGRCRGHRGGCRRFVCFRRVDCVRSAHLGWCANDNDGHLAIADVMRYCRPQSYKPPKGPVPPRTSTRRMLHD